MGKIRKLSILEAQKIAAGEVVERPANIVKELIENSIDAGAQTITLFIEEGGHRLIRCIDDGCGMDQEDVLVCFEHHTTSKMQLVDEISMLLTKGFRGEALSSICSVSRMSITSCTDSAHGGVTVTLEGGVVVDKAVCSASRGTDIVVRDIFYNLPARRKFLRKSETEFRLIIQIVSALALLYPAVSFVVYHNDRLHMQLMATHDFGQRVAAVMGTQFAAHSITGSSSTVVQQYSMGTPAYSWYDRSHIYIAVNGRWVKNPALVSAFVRGYKAMLPAGKYPGGVICLQVDPAYIDVNVHPRKEEVLLLHSRQVELVIEKVVREALSHWVHGDDNESAVVYSQQQESQFVHNEQNELFLQSAMVQSSRDLSFGGAESGVAHDATDIKSDLNTGHVVDENVSTGYKEMYDLLSRNNSVEHMINTAEYLSNNGSLSGLERQKRSASFVCSLDGVDTISSIDSVVETVAKSSVEQGLVNDSLGMAPKYEQQVFEPVVKQDAKPYRIVGQVFQSYIVVEHNKNIIFIDQHAAMERVLYEKCIHTLHIGESIECIAPDFVILDSEYVTVLESFFPLLEQIGFRLDVFSATKIVVRALPIVLKDQVIGDVLFAIATVLQGADATAHAVVELIYHKLAAMVSCKKAIKAGNVLQQQEMERLVADWYALGEAITCPHGRPTFFIVSHKDIDVSVRR